MPRPRPFIKHLRRVVKHLRRVVQRPGPFVKHLLALGQGFAGCVELPERFVQLVRRLMPRPRPFIKHLRRVVQRPGRIVQLPSLVTQLPSLFQPHLDRPAERGRGGVEIRPDPIERGPILRSHVSDRPTVDDVEARPQPA